MADLDSILSGASAAAPAPEGVKEPVTVETPETVTQEETAQTGGEGEPQGQKMVPHEALHAEKQKVKRYTEQVADFDKRLAEQNTAWERRFEQLLETVKPKEAAPAAPDFWENPDAYLSGKLAPVQQQIETQRDQFSRMLAETAHGADAVGAAYAAFDSSPPSPEKAAQYAAIKQAANPYSALVEWHKRAQAQAEIGSDPAAYREKLKAELLAELQGGNAPAPASAAPVMPSNFAAARNVGNRGGPAWSGPQPLSDIFKR